MLSPLRKLAGAAAALALVVSPTAAAAAPVSVQPVNPLIAVSIYGSKASAQAVCSGAASAAASAGAAVAAQGQPGCVLPAADAPPPPAYQQAALAPVAEGGMTGIGWLLAGLDLLIAGAGIATLFDDDDDDDDDQGGSPV